MIYINKGIEIYLVPYNVDIVKIENFQNFTIKKAIILKNMQFNTIFNIDQIFINPEKNYCDFNNMLLYSIHIHTKKYEMALVSINDIIEK